MRTRLTLTLCLCAAMLLATGASAASAASGQIGTPGPAPAVSGQLGAPRYTVIPLQGVSPSTINKQVAAGTTVATWSSSLKSPTNGHIYPYRMIGNTPLVHEASPVSKVPTDVIPVSLHFVDSGITFDPTAPSPGCLNGPGTADSLFRASPVFGNHAYPSVGTTQYLDAFQRANFAKYTVNPGAINPGYHVQLSPVANRAKVSLSVNTTGGITTTGGCSGALGTIDISAWDNYLQTTLLPQLKAKGLTGPTHFPIFLFYDVVLTQGVGGSCCIIGYHSAYSSPVQTYATGDYVSNGTFTNLTDVAALSHEVGEWMDDPYGNNATPAWGHIGQVSGCQANLEVGDPLSGTQLGVTMANHVPYKVQELAFRDWFYRTPSVGLHGWFSNNGKFKTSAGPLCH